MDVYFYLKLLLIFTVFFLCYWFRTENRKKTKD